MQSRSRRGSSSGCAARAVTPAEVVGLAEPYAPDTPLLALALEDLPAAAPAYFSACAASGSRSRAPTSPSSAWASRRGWGRCSPSFAVAS